LNIHPLKTVEHYYSTLIVLSNLMIARGACEGLDLRRRKRDS
jgi:hypothetical protein